MVGSCKGPHRPEGDSDYQYEAADVASGMEMAREELGAAYRMRIEDGRRQSSLLCHSTALNDVYDFAS